mmetsp:Transcript_24555/g.36021  ORF Transcript_24555/g.36021 Transcript_24555/m.36021 type:complete len:84 (+) Transcript_24555:162-413(+)
MLLSFMFMSLLHARNHSVPLWLHSRILHVKNQSKKRRIHSNCDMKYIYLVILKKNIQMLQTDIFAMYETSSYVVKKLRYTTTR